MMFMLDDKTAPNSRSTCLDLDMSVIHNSLSPLDPGIAAEMHGWVDRIIQTEGPLSFFTLVHTPVSLSLSRYLADSL